MLDGSCCFEIIAYNTRERLVELFKEVYKDKRDCKQILDMITSRGGIVKRFGKTLVVILDRFHNRKYQKAAEDFCNRGCSILIIITITISYDAIKPKLTQKLYVCSKSLFAKPLF